MTDVRELITVLRPDSTTPFGELRNAFTHNWSRVKTLLSTGQGVTGTFTTVDGKTITVTDGIVTDIT